MDTMATGRTSTDLSRRAPEAAVQDQQSDQNMPCHGVVLGSQHGHVQTPLGLVSASQIKIKTQQLHHQQQILSVALKPSSRQETFLMIPVPALGGNPKGSCETTRHICEASGLPSKHKTADTGANTGATKAQATVRGFQLPVPPGMADTSPGLPGSVDHSGRCRNLGDLATLGFGRLRSWDEPFVHGDDFPDISTPTDSTFLGSSKHGAHNSSGSPPTYLAASSACSSNPPGRFAGTQADQSIQSASAVQQLIDSAAIQPAGIDAEVSLSADQPRPLSPAVDTIHLKLSSSTAGAGRSNSAKQCRHSSDACRVEDGQQHNTGQCVTLFAVPDDIAAVLEASMAADQLCCVAAKSTSLLVEDVPYVTATVAAAAKDFKQAHEQLSGTANTPLGSAAAASAWQLWQTSAIDGSSTAPSPSLLPLPATLLIPAYTANPTSAWYAGTKPTNTTTDGGGPALPEASLQHAMPTVDVTAAYAFTFPAVCCPATGSVVPGCQGADDTVSTPPAQMSPVAIVPLLETAANLSECSQVPLLSSREYPTMQEFAQQVISCCTGHGVHQAAAGHDYLQVGESPQASDSCCSPTSCLDQLIMQAVPFICDSVAAGLLVHTCFGSSGVSNSHATAPDNSICNGLIDRLYGTFEVWDALDDMISSLCISSKHLAQGLRCVRGLCSLALAAKQSADGVSAPATAAECHTNGEKAERHLGATTNPSFQVILAGTVCFVLEKALSRKLKRLDCDGGHQQQPIAPEDRH